jgi:predicted mannosyl-3-phosphoglycerate phosphatase (HAD superfamily)
MKERILAIFYDFDETLVPGYSPEVVFNYLGVDTSKVWNVANNKKNEAKKKGINLDLELGYLNLVLESAEGKEIKLSNTKLRELGKNVQLFKGLPEFFGRTKKFVEKNFENTTLEHYIISTGIKEVIAGSAINNEDLTDIFAAEFLEVDGKIKYVARAIGHQKKTEFIYQVNKGVNINHATDVNTRMKQHQRRVHFKDMMFLGDGLTDVPSLSMMKDRGGMPIGVYNPDSQLALKQATQLIKEERVFFTAPADYSIGSKLSRKIEKGLHFIASR